jgi:hypothetical protein
MLIIHITVYKTATPPTYPISFSIKSRDVLSTHDRSNLIDAILFLVQFLSYQLNLIFPSIMGAAKAQHSSDGRFFPVQFVWGIAIAPRQFVLNKLRNWPLVKLINQFYLARSAKKGSQPKPPKQQRKMHHLSRKSTACSLDFSLFT